MNNKLAPRDGFGDALLALGQRHRQAVVLTADLMESTRTAAFAAAFPDRFFNVGVAEQNMMGIAAGLANEGLIPFCASFAAFNPGRNWEQIRVSVCYDNANVKIIGSHAGLSVGPDGATHQMLEDIALMRVLPNMVVLAPADAHETRAATLAAARHIGPVYIRFGRAVEPVVSRRQDRFTIGKAVPVLQGDDISIFTTGSMRQQVEEAVRQIGSKASVELIHFPTVKPLDTAAVVTSAKKTRFVITVEEAQVGGGFGGAVAETLAEQYPVPLRRLGVQDRFGQSGQPDELRRHYGLAVSDIEAAIVAAMIAKNA